MNSLSRRRTGSRELICTRLEGNTYTVDVAESGQKALELGADVPYDAVLLDVRLSDLSGIEVSASCVNEV